ncbi:hypothetical protein NX059_001176 [Plenodomus lindquistii]|nr:hypothetical protein NX059_001176 [Plenodomus lindquistii]
MRGYFYSVKPGMGQIPLTLNACTSAFYQPILVSEFLRDEATFKNRDERLAALRNLGVQLTYEPKRKDGKPRSKAATIASRMKNIMNGGKPCSVQTFTLEKGGDVTVKDHFEKTYGRKLQYPNSPAFNCGTHEKAMWYPPETLQILPYQLYKGKVPESTTNDMINAACQHPADTRALIEHEGLPLLGCRNGTGFVPACPVVLIDPRMLKVQAAELPLPTVTYGGTASKNRAAVKDGKWNPVGCRFVHLGSIKLKLYVIVVPEKSNMNGVYELTREDFARHARTYGMEGHIVVGGTYCSVFTRPEVAERVFDEAKAEGANFVFLIVEEKKNVPAYSILKDLADRQYGMQSLCAIHKLDKEGRSFGDQQWGNLMMKVNLKAGGTNHVNPDVSKLLANTLVLGA